MDSREPIPLLIKRFNFRIPMINAIPYIGIKWAGVAIGVLTAMTYTGLLIWSLFPPTKLAVLPALNLVWSILLIIGVVMKKPMLLLPALGSSAIALVVLALFVIIDGFIFIILVTVEWKFSSSEYLQNLVASQVGIFDWKWALYDFYLLLCLLGGVIFACKGSFTRSNAWILPTIKGRYWGVGHIFDLPKVHIFRVIEDLKCESGNTESVTSFVNYPKSHHQVLQPKTFLSYSTVVLAFLWVVIFSLLRSMRGDSEPNGMELDIKFKSAPVECVNAYPK